MNIEQVAEAAEALTRDNGKRVVVTSSRFSPIIKEYQNKEDEIEIKAWHHPFDDVLVSVEYRGTEILNYSKAFPNFNFYNGNKEFEECFIPLAARALLGRT